MCKWCGEQIIVFHAESAAIYSRSNGVGQRWVILNKDNSPHLCGPDKSKVKVFSEEEKKEFARKRSAKEI